MAETTLTNLGDEARKEAVDRAVRIMQASEAKHWNMASVGPLLALLTADILAE